MYQINKDSKDPIYSQIANQIQEAILSGTLSPGTRLMDSRTLAKHLNISRNTVNSAYALLISNDLIYSIQGSGYYVTKNKKRKVIKESEIKTSSKIYKYDLSDFNTKISMSKSKAIYKFYRKELQMLSYLDIRESYSFRGIDELLGEIRKLVYDYADIKCETPQIFIGNCNEYALSSIFTVIPNPIHAVAISNRNDIRLNHYLISRGYKIVHYKDFSKDELNQIDADVIIVTPSHHHDMPGEITLQERHNIIDWANKKPFRHIIENDYNREFVNDNEMPSIYSLDYNERTFYVSSFSILFGSDIRCNYTIIPSQYSKRMNNLRWFESCPNPFITQWIIYRYLITGNGNKYIRIERKNSKTKLQFFTNTINKYIPNKFHIISYDCRCICLTFLVDKTTQELITQFREAGIDLSLTDNYILQKEKIKNCFVINYTRLSEKELVNAIMIISKILVLIQKPHLQLKEVL